MKKFLLLLCTLLGTAGAWAADITLSPSDGAYSSSGNYTNTWTATSTPVLTITASANNMDTRQTGDYLLWHTGQAQSSTYTLSVPDGYLIKNFSITGTANSEDQTATAGETTTTFTAEGSSTFAVTGLSAITTSFTLTGANSGLKITSIYATIEIDPYYTEFDPTNKTFTLQCARGYVYYNGSTLAGTAEAASASQFAVVSYNDNTYLYDATQKAFVCHTTAAKAGNTGNAALESKNDFSKVVKNISFGATGISNYPYYVQENEFTNWLNMDGTPQVFFNRWTNFEGGNGGNTYKIETVATDFDATEAIAMLDAYFNPPATVKYVISDANGVALETEAVPATVGEVITALPANLQRAFCSYSEINHTIVAGANTVNVTVTYDMPFTEGKWYFMTLRGHYVYYNASADDVRTNQTDKEESKAYQWGFSGTPYTGIKVQNRQTETYLTNTASPVKLTAEGFGWTLARLDNTTTFGLANGSQYINEQNHTNHNLIYWTQFSDDTGSQFQVEEVPNDIVYVNYNVVLDGRTILTEEKGHHVGDAVSLPEGFARDYTTYTLDATEITASTTDVTVTPTFSTLPFETSTDFASAKWYYMYGHSYYNGSGVFTDGESLAWRQGIKEDTDAYLWAFIGNPVEGFKIINKASGADKYVQGSAPVSMGSTEKTWLLKEQTNAEYLKDGKGFGFWDASLSYINVRSGQGNLQYWTGFDQGSTFWVEAVADNYYANVKAEILPFIFANPEDIFNSDPAPSIGSLFGLSVEAVQTIVSTFANQLANQTFTIEDYQAIAAAKEAGIIYPENGKFYVIKNVSNGKYLNVKSASGIYADADEPTSGSIVQAQIRDGKTYFATQAKEFGWCYTTDYAALLDAAGGGKYAHFTINTPGQVAFAHSLGNGEGNFASYLPYSYYTVGDNNQIVGGTATGATAQWTFEEAANFSITLDGPIDGSYYATLSVPYDIAAIDGAKAYTVAKGEGTQLTTTEVSGTIAAGTPVLLVGTSNSATATIGSNYSTDISTETALTGSYLEIAEFDGATNYILGSDGTKAGFLHSESTTLKANTAYIAGDESTSSIEAFYFDLDTPEGQAGDVNNDSKVTIADVTALVNIILGKDDSEPYQYDHVAADVNNDGKVTIADVTALVNIILGNKN